MEASAKKRSTIWIAVLPLVVFLGLVIVFYSLLTKEGRDTSAVPSALLNRPVPLVIMPPLAPTGLPGIDLKIFAAAPINVVNVFASWCVPCRQEHPQIERLGEEERIQLIGINHKDGTRNAMSFLTELGNPYDAIGVDRNGRGSIEWGVYGVPETFFVDSSGIIFHKHVGPISAQQLERDILPLLEQRLANAS
ncbi:MAG: DsbE family thiol:disulfide interchange protein [Pseudomonadota bacterium]